MEDIQETERRRNGGTVFNENYSDQAIFRLKEMVQTFFEQNKRKFYAILVDGETVVKKTSDSRKFDGYQDFITDYTKKVEVRMFLSESLQSPNCNRYIFRIGGTLAGVQATPQIDVQAEIKKALKKQRLEDELGQLQKQVVKLQKALDKAPTVDWDKMLEKAVGAIALIKGNKGLSGAPQNNSNQSEVTVEGVSTDSQTESTGAQVLYDALVEQQGLGNMLKTLEALKIMGEHPDIGDKVNEMLNTKNKKNGKA